MERYRRETRVYCIDLRFNEINQLYDTRDPSPFRERDLDENLVDYVVMAMEELPPKESKKVVLIGPPFKEGNGREEFIEAFHRYFEHEARAKVNELKQLLKYGRTSFFFGLLFLIICLVIGNWVGDKILIHRIFREGLGIIGWVALWNPINIFLYEWWPHLAKIKVYRYLAKIKVEFK